MMSSEPFTVAQGHSTGLSRKRMRGPDLDRPFHGVRLARSPADAADSVVNQYPPWTATSVDVALLARCRALGLVLPDDGFFSHITAARLWPLPLPRARGNEPVHVAVRSPHRGPRRRGTAGHEIADPLTTWIHRHGLPVVDPASLFCQLALQVSRPDLVAAGDALVLQPKFAGPWDDRPWASIRELRERVDRYRGRGKRVAADAVELIRQGAESRPETLLRLAMVDAGLPEPAVNADILAAGGRFIGRGDLVYREWRVVVEYDGDQHRVDTTQFDKDIRRLEAFAANGWCVVRITGRSFFADRRACVGRVERALLLAGWRR